MIPGKFLTLRDSSARCSRNPPETLVGDPSPRQTSTGNNSGCVMKSERGARSLGAPTHPMVTEFTQRPVICGGRLPGVWEKNIWPLVHRKQMTKNLDPSTYGKNRHFSGLARERRTSRATSRPLDHGSTFYFGSHKNSLASPDTKRVDRRFILYRDRRCIVGWCLENRRQKNSIPL